MGAQQIDQQARLARVSTKGRATSSEERVKGYCIQVGVTLLVAELAYRFGRMVGRNAR